jgi:hypothetical protein
MVWFSMINLSFVAAGIMALLGLVHLIYTLIDFGSAPKYFRPLDESVLTHMRETKTAIAPQGRDYWSGVLGFNLSHSIGLILFGVLIGVATSYEIHWLKPILVATGLIYTAIAYRCWFNAPALGAALATGLLVLGWV